MSGECGRRAWLVLAGYPNMALEDDAGAWFCSELDIAWPEIRSVTSNRPDRDGVDDRTALFGARAVTAKITAMAGADTVDDIARRFAPFMIPAARPELHWTLDTPADDHRERMLVVRATDFSAPITGSTRWAIQLAWTAPDPIVRDAEWRQVDTRPGVIAGGFGFPITFDLTFGGATPAVPAQMVSAGDVPVTPVITIWGPITGPALTLQSFPPGAPATTRTLTFLAGYRIDPGHWLSVDVAARTCVDDTGRHQEAQIDYAATTGWPVGLPNGVQNVLQLTGTSYSPVTVARATWRDGWVTG